jgi:hypothetical protein
MPKNYYGKKIKHCCGGKGAALKPIGGIVEKSTIFNKKNLTLTNK